MNIKKIERRKKRVKTELTIMGLATTALLTGSILVSASEPDIEINPKPVNEQRSIQYTVTELDSNPKYKSVREKEKIKSEEQLYVDILVNEKNLDRGLADHFVNILKYHSKVPMYLVLGMIQRESTYTNKYSDFKTEDSAGYVQMRSETIKDMRKMYPQLPKIYSQEDFMNKEEEQIMYMVTYLNHAMDKFNGDIDKSISSYNMGLYNKKYNSYYVGYAYKYGNAIKLKAEQSRL